MCYYKVNPGDRNSLIETQPGIWRVSCTMLQKLAGWVTKKLLMSRGQVRGPSDGYFMRRARLDKTTKDRVEKSLSDS